MLSLYNTNCIVFYLVYTSEVPKLWSQTIGTHRRAVQEAALDAAASLATEAGLRGVTMSKIAERTGIGRATLYKYFPDIESLLAAWHERHVNAHLDRLAKIATERGTTGERLRAVLLSFAQMSYKQQHGRELAALLHRGAHVARAHKKLHDFVRDLILRGAQAGELRSDIDVEELTQFSLHAISAASALQSTAAVSRLVEIIMSGLQPPK